MLRSFCAGATIALLLFGAGACRSPAAPSPAPSIEPTARCPIVPLRLAIQAPGQPPLSMKTLDARGKLVVTTAAGRSLDATLDARGCLIGTEGLWVELTPRGKLWTPHEVQDVNGTTIPLASGAKLRIASDGTVERLTSFSRAGAGVALYAAF